MKPLVPVLTLTSLKLLPELAELLLAHRLNIVEVTLRTDLGLQAIQEFCRHPGLEVWAGSVRTPAQAQQALDAGATRLVSPGYTPALLQEVLTLGASWLPGVQTVSEAMQLQDNGFVEQKFFPAQAAGGLPWLKAVAAPLPELRFCPSGGIDMLDVRHFLHQENVFALALSKLVPSDILSAIDLQTLDQKLCMRLMHIRELEHEV